MKSHNNGDSGHTAFTLTELLTVVGILAMLAAMTAPSLIHLVPSRKAQISKVFTYLEMARARAMASKQDMYVCFADAAFPDPDFKYRALAMFSAASMTDETQPIDRRELRQVENWLELTPDVMLGVGADFKHRTSPTPTVLDSQEKREFVFRRKGKDCRATLPYLVFNRAGRLEVPFTSGSEIFVGIVDGFVDSGGVRQIKRPVSGGGVVGDLIAIHFADGKMSHLRD